MPQRKINISRIAALFMAIILIIYFDLFVFLPKSIPSFLRVGLPSRPLNILVLATDTLYDKVTGRALSIGGNSDSIMFFNIDPLNQRINAVSIPRDSYVEIPDYGWHKVNAAFPFGGIDLSIKTISSMIDMPIDGYVVLQLDIIPKLIDQLGGVHIFVDKDMYYVDNAANLHINLKKGWQKLNGKQAHDFMRFRMDALGDINRIKRQQALTEELVKEIASAKNIFKLPFIINTIRENLNTNLSLTDIFRIVNFARMLDNHEIRFLTLSGSTINGTSAGSVWAVDKTELAKIKNEYFRINKN